MKVMFWKFTMIFFSLKQIKCQENLIWNISRCEAKGNVTRALKTNFSVTLRRNCEEANHGCETPIIFNTTRNKDFKITVSKENKSPGQHGFDGLTLKYAWTIIEGVTFNVTLHSSDMREMVTLKLKDVPGCTAAKVIALINFTGCQNHSQFSVATQNQLIARFLDSGNITCDGYQNMSGRAVYNNGSEAIQTWCMFNATWKDADEITCVYPIHAEVRVNGYPISDTITLFYDQSANESNVVMLDCSTNDGTQNSAVKKFLLQTELLNGSSITIHPNLNGEKVSCYFENNYTRYFKNHVDTYSSPTTTLNITFGPYPPKVSDSLCAFPNGSIIFYSNPLAKTSSLTLLKGNENEEIVSHITECCGMEYGVNGQMITSSENLTEFVKLTLRANSSGKDEFYEVIPCSKETTPATSPNDNESPETTTNQSQITTIIFACSGVLLLLIVIGVILICRKRCAKEKLKSGSDKVENVNPLYGTSDDVALEAKSDEQVVNPLYGTAENDTEVYSVVDKKNKKGKKGKKPQRPTKGNEDLYASVDKGKGKTKGKENSGFEAEVTADATYTVVDKKKKGAQKANESSTGDVDTYAVVDRTNKKRKGAGGDDLHGSTIQ